MVAQEIATTLSATDYKATVAGSVRTLRGTGLRRVPGAVTGACILLVWVSFSLYLLLGAVAQGAQERFGQAHAGSANDGARAEASVVADELPAFYQLMDRAREVCPAGRDLLLLGDEKAAYELAAYYMYPRRVVFIGTDRPFGSDDLISQAGGCVANYGPVSGGRLERYSPVLDPLRCVQSGCLYMVNRSSR